MLLLLLSGAFSFLFTAPAVEHGKSVRLPAA